MGFTTEGRGTLVRVLDDYMVLDHNSEDFIKDILRNVASNSSAKSSVGEPIGSVEVYIVITTDVEIVKHKGRYHGIIPLKWYKDKGLFVVCPKCHKRTRPEEFYPKPDWVKQIEKMHPTKAKPKKKSHWKTKKINERVKVTQYERPKKHSKKKGD
jgi:hypothetical protein